MLAKILVALAALIGVFLIYVSSKPGAFRYERSGVINASADKIFPHLRDFKLGTQWSPYQKIDPNMKMSFSGSERGVGSIMDFVSDKAGTGRLEILKEELNSTLELSLKMTRPMNADNLVYYKLTPEGEGTRFTWAMSGESGFSGKLFSTFIDCDKMVGDQFLEGIQNLKKIVEAK